MNEEMTKMQKALDKTRDEVSEKLDNLSFQSAKDSIDQATKQARENFQSAGTVVRDASQSATKVASQAVRDGIDQAQRLNEGASKQAASRTKEYSEFVMDHPISATVGAFFVGYVVSRWIR